MPTEKPTPKPAPKPEIEVGGFALPLVAPASFALREDVISTWDAATGSAQIRRAFGFALGSCCRELGRRSGARYDGASPLLYGGDVYDYLRKCGVTSEAISAAAHIAFSLCVKSLTINEPAVSAREVFTGPSEDSPT